MKRIVSGAAALLMSTALVLPVPVAAQGSNRPVRLEPLVLGSKQSDFAMSVKEYNLEAGKTYRWVIKSSGLKEYGLVAPEFFPTVKIEEVKIAGLEVKPTGLEEVEFDDEGSMEITMVPQTPGTYEFRIKQFVKQGMVGKITVK